MKHLKIVLVACLMILGVSQLSAQGRFGIVGGANFSESSIKSLKKDKITQYQAGITYQLKLPLGFAIQPSLLYQAKGMKFDVAGETGIDKLEGVGNVLTSYNYKLGFIELPVSIQWGLDLLILRPYLEVVPFIGCAVANNGHDWNDINRFEGGIGLGGGIDIWKFQINCRYNWNFGSLTKSGSKIHEVAKEELGKNLDKANFRGVTLSLAFLF